MRTYLTASINNSPTLIVKAASEIYDVRFKAIALDESGKGVVASTAGEVVLGIAIPTTGDAEGLVEKDGDIDVQIKDIGLAEAGAVFSAGTPLMTNTDGQLVAATAGNFIVGYAITAAASAGDVIQVQIAKGYCPTASGT